MVCTCLWTAGDAALGRLVPVGAAVGGLGVALLLPLL